MHPLLLVFADGTIFFVGLVIVLVATLVNSFNLRRMRPVLTVTSIVGIIFVLISATPLPIWAYLGWLVVACAGVILINRPQASRRIQIAVPVVMAIVSTLLFISEASYRQIPRILIPSNKTIYVLGDSMSAGKGTGETNWPEVLNGRIVQKVVNLAQPGAITINGGQQAKGIKEPGSLVIVELGGNDLLGETEATVFREQLDSLIASLCADGHRVLVVELPLPPFRNAFGEVQRSIVAKYGVDMLPKRCMTGVLGIERATLDGLHFSQTGHDAMAEIFAGVIGSE